MTVYTTNKKLSDLITDTTPTSTLNLVIGGTTKQVHPSNQFPFTLSSVNGKGDLIFPGYDDFIEYDDKGVDTNRPPDGQTLDLTFSLGGDDGDLSVSPVTITLTITGAAASTAPTLTSVSGVATGATTANLSFDTDTGSGNAVLGVYLSTATTPSRAQLRDGKDGDGAALVFTGAVNPVSSTGTHTVSASGLTNGATYKLAVQQDNGADQSTVVESAAFTVSAPATIAEQVDGLDNGATGVGRTSANTLKTLGELPSGVSLGSSGNFSLVTFTADDVTLEDFDLTDTKVNFNGRTGCTVQQCKMISTVAPSNSAAKINIPVGSDNAVVSYCDVWGYYGASGNENQLILHSFSGTGLSASCANGVILDHLDVKWGHADGVHTAGGGIDVRWNLFGPSASCNVDIQDYSGTPGDYTTGDYVRFTSGGIFGYTARCLSATPTTGPVKSSVTSDWDAKNIPHTDILNPRASIGSGLTTQIRYNFFRDYIFTAEGARAVNINNFIRTVRNSGRTEPIGRMDIIGNKSNRAGTGPAIPMQFDGGTNVSGPFNFQDNRIGLSANGAYYNGSTSLVGTWSGNVNSLTGATLAAP